MAHQLAVGMKTAEFGQPCAAVPEAGKCRICGGKFLPSDGSPMIHDWADETRTLCDKPACIAEAKREIGR